MNRFNDFWLERVLDKNGIEYILRGNGSAYVARDHINCPSHIDIAGNIEIHGAKWKVTEIAPDAFHKLYGTVEEIVLPNTLKKIGEGAFAYCDKLKRVVIGKNVKTIEQWAFDGCHCLVDVVFLGSKPPKLGRDTIALKNPETKRTLWLPNADENSGFKKEDWFADTVRYGAYPEWYTEKQNAKNTEPLNKFKFDVVIDQNGTSYWLKDKKNASVLYQNDEDKFITDPVNPMTRDERYSINIAEKIEFCGHKWTVTSINMCAFEDDKEMTSLKLPDFLKEIGCNAFCSCSNLKSVIFPKNLKEIECAVISCCENLKKIVIQENVKKIDPYGFHYCESLSDIIFLGTEPPKIKTRKRYARDGYDLFPRSGCERILWLPNVTEEQGSEFNKEKWHVDSIRFGAYPDGLNKDNVTEL